MHGKTSTASSNRALAPEIGAYQKFGRIKSLLDSQRVPWLGHPVQDVSARASNRYVPGGHSSASRVHETAPVRPRVDSPKMQALHAVDADIGANVSTGHRSHADCGVKTLLDVFMNVPTLQATHVVEPAMCACRPAEHAVHAVDKPSAANVPSAHSKHAVWKERAANLPRLHVTQVDAPALEVCVPSDAFRRHCAHAACPATAAYVPRAHSCGTTVAFPGQKCPVGQSIAALAPAAVTKRPSLASTQLLAPSASLKRPATHAWHSVADDRLCPFPPPGW